MPDERTPEEVQRVMAEGFFPWVDQLHKDKPEHSYNWCFMFGLRALHYGTEGTLDGAPPLPGTVPADVVFGEHGAKVEAMLAQAYPGKSQEWHRELAERILLGDESVEDELHE